MYFYFPTVVLLYQALLRGQHLTCGVWLVSVSDMKLLGGTDWLVTLETAPKTGGWLILDGSPGVGWGPAWVSFTFMLAYSFSKYEFASDTLRADPGNIRQ